MSSPTSSCSGWRNVLALAGQEHVDEPEDVLVVEGVEEVVGRGLGRAGAAGRRVAGDPGDGEHAGGDDRHRADRGGDDLAARPAATIGALGRPSLDDGDLLGRGRCAGRRVRGTERRRARSHRPGCWVGACARGPTLGLRGLPTAAVGHCPRPPGSSAAGSLPTGLGPVGELTVGTTPLRTARTLSDVRVAITGSHGLIGTALQTALTDVRTRARGGRPRRARRRTRSAGTRAPAGSTPARSSASTPSSTWPAPASATSAGATSTSARCWSRGPGRRRCWPTRSAGLDGGPQVLLSGSAIGFYGDRGDEELDETSAPRRGLPRRCRRGVGGQHGPGVGGRRTRRAPAHRHRPRRPRAARCRGCCRCSRSGSAGASASGRQWMSWIALDDEVGAIVHLLASTVSGAVNLTAPNPVRNAELAAAIGTVLHRPTRAAGAGVRSEAAARRRARRLAAVRGSAGPAAGPRGRRLPVEVPDARAGPARRPRALTRLTPGRRICELFTHPVNG